MPEHHRKLGDKEVVRIFVEYLAQHGNPGIKLDCCPDERARTSPGPTPPDIDGIAGHFAIEHTSIDAVPNQRRDSARFEQVVGPLENEFRCKLPFRLVMTFPYHGIQSGQDWPKISAATRKWLLNEAPKLPLGSHRLRDIPDIPFEIRIVKKESSHPGLLFGRFSADDPTFPQRLRDHLDRKIEKLSPYKVKNLTTLLLIESNDVALMNEAIMWAGLGSAFPRGLPQGLDQIWFADTSIPDEILFTDMTEAVVR